MSPKHPAHRSLFREELSSELLVRNHSVHMKEDWPPLKISLWKASMPWSSVEETVH